MLVFDGYIQLRRRVGGQQQRQTQVLDVKIAELDVNIEGQHSSTLSPEMKEYHGVDGTQAPPKVDDNFLSGEE